MVIVNKLNCRFVVGKCGRYVVSMWSVRGRYVVGNERDVIHRVMAEKRGFQLFVTMRQLRLIVCPITAVDFT